MTTKSPPRIIDFIKAGARNSPDRPSLVMPDGTFLTYGALHAVVEDTARFLIERGLMNDKRIAVIMPNGPEMVVAFLAVSQVAIYAPLNPALPAEELAKYLKIIGADAIMVRHDQHAAVAQHVSALDLPVLVMQPYRHESPASFVVAAPALPATAEPLRLPGGDDVAIVLTTSGTISAPKVVPLTHANLCWAATNNADFFNLAEDDRCLNIIPQYHIYSIVASILSSLAAGGSVICSESFRPDEFVNMLEQLAPTWFAASPAIHQAILRYLETSQSHPIRHNLQCIRSGGAPLSAQLQAALERCFGVVVVQGYGLTETSAMGTRNPPEPGRIKPGSAGVVTGCELQIIDEEARPLTHSQVGRILIKGPGVTPGYENDETVEEPSFMGDWLVTGDQGYLDEDGYLFITGRTKELINRGGSKFSPGEVESALSEHPDVIDVAVYAAPHTRLGEVPMALVVLRPQSGARPAHLKSFLRDKIALHKIPVKLTAVQDIPKSPSGKIRRHQLHQHGLRAATRDLLSTASEHTSADGSHQGSEMVRLVKKTWQQVLGLEDLNPADDFFDMGGDSLLFAELVVELEKATGRKIPLASIVSRWTIEQQAEELSGPRNSSPGFRFLFPIRNTGKFPPLFCIHDVTGSSFTFRPLADHLPIEQPVWAFWLNPEDRRLADPLDIQELASEYIKEMRKVQAHGPYLIIGHSMGGELAFEMARQLRDLAEEIALLAMIDTWKTPPRRKKKKNRINEITEDLRTFSETPYRNRLLYLHGKIIAELQRVLNRFSIKLQTNDTSAHSLQASTVKRRLHKAGQRYQLACYDGAVIYFKSETDEDGRSQAAIEKYRRYADSVRVILSPGQHGEMLKEPNVNEFASKLVAVIQTALNANANH